VRRPEKKAGRAKGPGYRCKNTSTTEKKKSKDDCKMKVHVTKTVPIEFKWVVDAYQAVRQGGKACGIDGESWSEFEKDAERHCYLIWNRLASGSYHPQAVRSVEIPKKDGTMRKLGIPTLRDRIAQQVVKDYMEKRIDGKFHENSYGYRPVKSAHEALRQVRANCLGKDWVIDMDISKFFDEIDHEVMLKAVSHILPEESWVLMYVKRWLEMPVQEPDGSIREKGGKGTPQGGVISPILANLYLHYTLDVWLSRNYPEVSFVRYADDMVVHCNTREEAEQVLSAIRERLLEVKLSIKESKTRIAYCRDYRRKGNHDTVKFEFLGFSYQPTEIKNPQGGYFTGYGGAISVSNAKRITEEIRKEQLFSNTGIEIKAIAAGMDAKIRGWINYYGLFSKRQIIRVLGAVEARLIKWLRKKHRLGYRKAVHKLNAIKQEHPTLFYHWKAGNCSKVKKVTRAV
jgi:RNA-directed DNA polymerase